MTGPSRAEIELRPADVAAYLATTGWALEQTRGEAAEIWRLERSGTRLLLPRDATYDDYQARFADALALLRALHEFTDEQLAVSVAGTRMDVLYVRADQAAFDGTIALRQADALVSGSLQLMQAAAQAAERPRASYAGRRSNTVNDFIEDDLRMGHTQRGSFVITVLTRLGDPSVTEVPEELRDGPDSPETVRVAPFQRRVTTTLSTALTAAARASASRRLPGLIAGVDRGASANLYDALAKMTSYEGLRALDLSFNWAPAEPQESGVDSVVLFTRDEVPQFANARERLTARPLVEKDTITGQVVRLERGEDQDEGVITITGVVGRGTRRNVRLLLRGGLYAAAVRAHQRRTPVTCSGELERKGTTYWMRNPDFRVVGA